MDKASKPTQNQNPERTGVPAGAASGPHGTSIRAQAEPERRRNVRCDGPVRPGPSLAEWAQTVDDDTLESVIEEVRAGSGEEAMASESIEAHVTGDDITTDHISPAGAIPKGGEAGRYLVEQGDPAHDLNVFSSRRGNWQAMLRGLFTNKSVQNLLATGIPPGSTILPDGTVLGSTGAGMGE